MEKWMKVLGGLMVVALVAMVFAGVALAQGPNGDDDGARDLNGKGYGRAWGFVDEDGDGVNDRYTENCDDSEFVDEDGDGVCDLHGEGYRQGRYGRGRVNSAQGLGVQGGRGYGEGDGVPDNVHALGDYMGRGRGRRGG